MKNRMLSKRVYFTVSALMMLVLFMFQFSGIIRKKYIILTKINMLFQKKMI